MKTHYYSILIFMNKKYNNSKISQLCSFPFQTDTSKVTEVKNGL